MSEINDKKVEVEIVETNTIKAEISIKEIKDILFDELYGILDTYHLYYDKPCIEYHDNNDSLEVYVTGLDDYSAPNDIIKNLEENLHF